jgi:hypothetical protein
VMHVEFELDVPDNLKRGVQDTMEGEGGRKDEGQVLRDSCL